MHSIVSNAPDRNVLKAGFVPTRDPLIDALLDKTFVVKEGTIESTSYDTQIDPHAWYKLVQSIWKDQVLSQDDKAVWIDSYNATDEMYTDLNLLISALSTFYEKSKDRNKNQSSNQNRPKNSRVISRIAKKYGIDTDSKDWQHFISNWTNQFNIRSFDYEVRWTYESFAFLGNIPGIDASLSCYSTTYQGRHGAWADAPVSLAIGLGCNLPTFVILLLDKKENEKTPEYLGRCWGFLDTSGDRKNPAGSTYDYALLSNAYYHSSLKVFDINLFVQVLEDATKRKYRYNRIRPSGKETDMTDYGFPCWVNPDPVFCWSENLFDVLHEEYLRPLETDMKCYNCKTIHQRGESYYVHLFCTDCRTGVKSTPTPCCMCGTHVRPREVHVIQSRPYCITCYSFMKRCGHCNTIFFSKDCKFKLGSRLFCSEACYQDNVKVCFVCNTKHELAITAKVGSETRYYCSTKHFTFDYFQRLEVDRLAKLKEELKRLPPQIPMPVHFQDGVYFGDTACGKRVELDTVNNVARIDGITLDLGSDILKELVSVSGGHALDTSTPLGVIKSLYERYVNAN